MGFIDFKAFNLALLAKQGCRLLQNTNSLFHHVFQAKYFAGRSFLEAQLSKRPSFAWRSIMASKSVVEDGIRWSIGNGDKVRMWNDKWIPNPETYKITTPINPLMSNEKVSALIDKERAVWKSVLVNSIFLPHEASAILAIPLSSTLPEDRRVWSRTTNGVFTIFEASRHYLVEFQSHCNSPQTHQPHAPNSWRPPPPGWYKTNVDGAVFKERGQCGIGVLIRNDKGQIMGALSETLPYPLGALETEAKAAKIGIIFSWELGLREIILKGDS
ncbi:hypothetical protein SO802_027119 [Lithocarpus litseifolius]|uniref:RNase H type-1 domain-containing protein n=1 Tax=Lithocarpus litseifolius TaxID=425828 RepID=A0AAW2C5B1_9ROSI